jgi:hypothetical protein
MHREESGGTVDCADCRVPVDLGHECGYQGAGDWALCQACGLRRGGHFDENEDRWTVPPDVTGLRPDDEHRVR